MLAQGGAERNPGWQVRIESKPRRGDRTRYMITASYPDSVASASAANSTSNKSRPSLVTK
jgi:hypothetical protein